MLFCCKWPKSLEVLNVTFFRSDVLGQVMPLVGRDWSHSGVARLFSAIKVWYFLKIYFYFLLCFIALGGIIPNFVLVSKITFYVPTRKTVINCYSLVPEQLFRHISRRTSSSIWNRYVAIVICLLVLFLGPGFLTFTDLGIYMVRIQWSCLLHSV